MATETRITSEQGKEAIYQAHLSKDAIANIEGMKASDSEIDNLKDSFFIVPLTIAMIGTDVTALIQDSLTNNDNVYIFTNGSFNITKPLVLKDNQSIFISNGTAINNIIDAVNERYIFKGDNVSNTLIKGGNLTKANLGNPSIGFTNSTNIKIEDVSIVHTAGIVYCEGISLRECDDVQIDNISVEGTTGHCVVFGTDTTTPLAVSSNFTLSNSTLLPLDGLALDVSGGYNSTLFSVTKATILNNIFRGGSSNGVKIQLTNECTFKGNTISGFTGDGLIINGQNQAMSDVKIDTNFIFNNGRGVLVTGFSLFESEQDCDFINNNIYSNLGNDFYFETAGGIITVKNNKLVNSNDDNISFGTTYSDRGTFIIEDNPLIKTDQTAINGVPYNISSQNNNYEVGNRVYAFDVESHKNILTNKIVSKGNNIKGSSSTPMYVRKEFIDTLDIDEDTYEDCTSSIAVYLRRPYDATSENIDIGRLIIKENTFDTFTTGVLIEGTYVNIRGSINNNYFKDVTTLVNSPLASTNDIVIV